MSNKYQEALNNIKTAPSFMGGNVRYQSVTQSSIPFMEDIATLQELVDKETPLMIKKTNIVGWELPRCECPKCGVIIYDDICKRCDNCGQRLKFF